jgi:hypothetical protein
MKYLQTHEGFINKVKTFIKDKIKEQEPNTENNLTGSEEKQSEFKEFVLDSITYLQDDFTITISFVESSFERGHSGETIHGERKTEARVKVQKQVRQGDENNIKENNFIVDDVKDQLLFMVERVIRHYNVLDVYFVYRKEQTPIGDDNLFTQQTGWNININISGKPHKLNKEDFEKLSFDTITSEVNVIFKLL